MCRQTGIVYKIVKCIRLLVYPLSLYLKFKSLRKCRLPTSWMCCDFVHAALQPGCDTHNVFKVYEIVKGVWLLVYPLIIIFKIQKFEEV